MTGLLITLGDQKAILFYLGFLPAFMDLSLMTWLDTVMVILVAALAVGSVKLGYAYVASQAGARVGTRMGTVLNVGAGCVMIAVGVFVLISA
jgi:threonine/homoserine/homoserine lactone efflux protein